MHYACFSVPLLQVKQALSNTVVVMELIGYSSGITVQISTADRMAK